MIIDIPGFIKEEQPYWSELEFFLTAIGHDDARRMDIKEIRRFHYLYQRASADLGRLTTFSSAAEIRSYLEALVARAYCEIHETKKHSKSFSPVRWFSTTLPRTFRAHIRAFYLSLAIILAGSLFGGTSVTFDPEARAVLMPFDHLIGDPSDRVNMEEERTTDHMEGQKKAFSSQLMTHNTQVAILTMALGITLGIGTIIILFFNGTILGAVALDYILAGETMFLIGWLLPHGAIEIPAILLGGQAGFMLAGAIIGRGSPVPVRERLAEISGDLVTIIAGASIMLVWAGIIEAFFSQYHEPVIPYWTKIAFGTAELILLIWYLSRCGRDRKNRN